MSDPIEMPGHGLDAEGGNTIGRTPTGDGDGDSGSGGETEFDAELVNLSNVLYADEQTEATVFTGNVERPFNTLQAAIEEGGNSHTLELGGSSYEAITILAPQSGVTLRGMGDPSVTARPSIAGATITGASLVVDHVLFNNEVTGTGSLFGFDSVFNAPIELDNNLELNGCVIADGATIGGDVILRQCIQSGPGTLSIDGNLSIDLYTLNSIRRDGGAGVLEVGGTMTILDAPTVGPTTVTADGDDTVQTFDVTMAAAKPGDTFAVSIAEGTPSTGQALGAAYCLVAGTVKVPVICIGATDTASLGLVVTLFPVATPAAP